MTQPKPHKPDFILAIVVVLLVVFGLIALSSAGVVVSYNAFGENFFFLKKQLIGAIVGIIAMFVVYRVNYRFWRKIALPLLIITLVLLVAVFIPGIGFEYGGARRWISVGPLFLQPTELVKLTFLIYLASWFDRKGKKGVGSFSYGFLSFIAILGVVTLLIMAQPDLGTMTVIALSALATYFAAGAGLAHLLIIIAGAGGLFWLLVKIAPYRLARITVFLNPDLDPSGIGYQVNQALLAIGAGGIFGLGLGHSQQKFNFLPEVTGDSIFAVIAEELGFIRSLFLIILFIILAIRGMQIAKKAPDNFSRLLSVGITAWLAFQAFINIAAMVNLVPLTGIPLPFISYGSSALVVSLVAAGILLNISRFTVDRQIKRHKLARGRI